jgi:hypothetical protein
MDERPARALEHHGDGAELDLVMSLHIAAAIHYGLGRHADAIPVLQRAVAVITVNQFSSCAISPSTV